MAEIKLNRLTLRDFQGGTCELRAGGEDVFVYAENAGGKTRLVSAFSWLLFNKDALGRSDFAIKNLDATGESEHNLEHSVEAELIVNGQPVVLKKTFSEKWTRKRGQAEREFTGHTTSYFVDGVPLQEKFFNEAVASMTGGEDRFRLLTSPTAFPALHWQKQRTLLLEICGDVSDADVLESMATLSNRADIQNLENIMAKRSLSDHRKVVIARRASINKDMETIPVRIDEVRRGLPDVTGIDRKAAESEVVRLEAAFSDAKLRLRGVDTGGQIAELSKRLEGLRADLRKMEEGHRSGSLSTLNRLNQQISETEAKVRVGRDRIRQIDTSVSERECQSKRTDQILEQLRQQWKMTDSDTFEDTIEDVCPACKQALPGDKVQAAREKALSYFNTRKAERLGEIDHNGRSLKEQKERIVSEIKALEEEKGRLKNFLPDMELELSTATTDRDALKASSEDFAALPGRADLLDEIDEVEGLIADERAGKTKDADVIKVEVSGFETNLRAAKGQVDLFVRRENGEKRIVELMAEEKKLAVEFEKLESELYLMDLFIKAKVSMLTGRINEKFEMVRFKLFNQNINGGIEDCAEITVNGVPYGAGLNNAARIQAGLDIIRTLQKHYGMRAPVFVDNRESVTDLPEMGWQVISLVVSPEDRVMRVEAVRERMAA